MSRDSCRIRSRVRALSVVELLMAVMVMGLVFTSMAALTTSVAQEWKASGQSQSEVVTAERIARSVSDAIRGAQAVLEARNTGGAHDSPHLLLWLRDDFGGSADGIVQAGEVALIELDPDEAVVWKYLPEPEAEMSPDERADASVTTLGDVNTGVFAETVKGYAFMLERQPLVGTPGTGDDLLKVDDAKFGHSYPTGGKPLVSYQFTLSGPDGQSESHGVTMLRAAQKPGNVAVASATPVN